MHLPTGLLEVITCTVVFNTSLRLEIPISQRNTPLRSLVTYYTYQNDIVLVYANTGTYHHILRLDVSVYHNRISGMHVLNPISNGGTYQQPLL